MMFEISIPNDCKRLGRMYSFIIPGPKITDAPLFSILRFSQLAGIELFCELESKMKRIYSFIIVRGPSWRHFYF